MLAIGMACLIIVLFAWLGGCVWCNWEGIQEDELVMSIGGGCMFLVTVGLICLGIASGSEEKKNPCIAWGQPQTTYVMVGKIMTPTTYTPCIRRQNEVEK